MEEKRYLKLWQKIAYGAGDFGSNFMFTFVSSFVVIYLTDTVGLDAAVIGMLMFASKCLDGVTDVFFGRLMDRTKSKMGKARPWMFWSVFPLAVCEILLFSTPDMDQKIQYVYFFVVYTLLNSIFYTANNISYATLTALMTKNPNESAGWDFPVYLRYVSRHYHPFGNYEAGRRLWRQRGRMEGSGYLVYSHYGSL